MNRYDTRTRAERALRLRSAGHSWATISEELGFKSRSGARLAVDRLLNSTAPDSVTTQRRTAVEALRTLRAILFDSIVDAKAAGDFAAVGALSDRARLNVAEEARIDGLYAPNKLDVKVDMTVAEALDQYRDRLLAVIDAEVIDDEPKSLEPGRELRLDRSGVK